MYSGRSGTDNRSQDFLAVNLPVFPFATPAEYVKLFEIRARPLVGDLLAAGWFALVHPRHLAGTLKNLEQNRHQPTNDVLERSPYWLGPPGTTGGRAVKYSLVPRFKGTAPPIDLKISLTTTWAMPGDRGMAFVNVVQSPAGTRGKVLWVIAECGRD